MHQWKFTNDADFRQDTKRQYLALWTTTLCHFVLVLKLFSGDHSGFRLMPVTNYWTHITVSIYSHCNDGYPRTFLEILSEVLINDISRFLLSGRLQARIGSIPLNNILTGGTRVCRYHIDTSADKVDITTAISFQITIISSAASTGKVGITIISFFHIMATSSATKLLS